jgi:hypothetical protein
MNQASARPLQAEPWRGAGPDRFDPGSFFLPSGCSVDNLDNLDNLDLFWWGGLDKGALLIYPIPH